MTRIRICCLCVALLVGSCADDGPVPSSPDSLTSFTTTSTTLDFGGLDLEVPDGFFAVPVPDAGFGLALPDGFQATLLTGDAIAILQAAGVPDAGFVSAALNAADAGALFYAAGLSPDGAVTDAKIDVQTTDDPDATLLQLSQDIASQGDLADIDMESDPDAGIVRIRFTSPGPDGSDERAQGTQFLYRAPEAVWSMIVTSEDPVGHDVAADAIGATFVLATSS